MKKNRIRLSESQLHRVIKESVNKVLKENIASLSTSFEELCMKMQNLSDGARITKLKCEEIDEPEDADYKYELTDESGYLISVYYE